MVSAGSSFVACEKNATNRPSPDIAAAPERPLPLLPSMPVARLAKTRCVGRCVGVVTPASDTAETRIPARTGLDM